MKFSDAVSHVFSNYACFSGRARRSEFWNFVLFTALIESLCGLLFPVSDAFFYVLSLFYLATLVPSLAVACRRLHDVGQSGWWLFLLVIPIGAVLLLVWFCQDSRPGYNEYGPNPKEVNANYMVKKSSTRQNMAVRCLSGPMQGQIFPMRSGSLSFGRDRTCGVRFPDGTPGVSGRHCVLSQQNGAPVLTDLGSTYGTFLTDGRKLPTNYPHTIYVGCCFYLGSGDNLFEVLHIR